MYRADIGLPTAALAGILQMRVASRGLIWPEESPSRVSTPRPQSLLLALAPAIEGIKAAGGSVTGFALGSSLGSSGEGGAHWRSEKLCLTASVEPAARRLLTAQNVHVRRGAGAEQAGLLCTHAAKRRC